VKKLVMILLFVLMMFMIGCSPKQAVAPTSAPKVVKEDILPPTNETKSNAEAEAAKSAERIAKIAEVSNLLKTGAVSRPYPEIYFDTDNSVIKPEGEKTLKSVSDSMIANPKYLLSIEGNCDERETQEYNLALGDRRAKAVFDYLQSLGIPKDRMSTFSYGKENPVCTEHAETCWYKNRRVHFVVTKGGVK